ncbi:MAG TPA: S9 family peptidase [Woeseiaceae bacterium]|nr:S9 family peptidase [Woeseiaceae bacterium]
MNRRFLIALILPGLLAGHDVLAEPFSAEHLVRLHRVGAPGVSPDGSQVVYTLRTTDMAANKGRFDLWLSSIDGKDTRQLTDYEGNETDPAWSPDGRFIYFLSSEGKTTQVWRIAPKGGDAKQVTRLPVEVGTFRISPGGDRLVVSLQTYIDCDDLACTLARDKALEESPQTGLVYEHLFMRHWDHWLSAKRSRLFALPLEGSSAADSELVLVSKAVDADVPSRVWGGNEEYIISNDGSSVFFAARIRDSKEPTSTNFDLYSAPMNGDGPTLNLTRENAAWDTQPVLSPDGKTLAYLAMQRPGFEADRFRVMIRDLESGRTRELAADWDRSASSIAFSHDGSSLLVNAQDTGNKSLWRFDVATGEAVKLVADGEVSAFADGARGTVFAKDDLKTPSELFVLDEGSTEARQLTHFSAEQLRGVEMGDYQQFSFAGANKDTVYGYVVKPAAFENGKQYPVAFLIHGGPQGSFSNHFHYRWNPQTYAGQGFAAVFIDFHGSTGYGQDFTDSISGDWGGKPFTDLQLGLKAALKKFAFLDGEKVCALGASYGGYMINWIAGNWPERFNCLVNHDGVFDNRMMYYGTEELWFPEWENGGPYYSNPKSYEKFNPVNYVDRWQTPMLVIHGQLDYRIPVSQGIGAFTALQRQGIASRFLYFPDENHWVQKPQNSLQWHDEVNGWLHRYLD